MKISQLIFDNFQFWPMLKNTIGINLLGSLVGLPATLLFALLLNEITSTKFKSLIQTDHLLAAFSIMGYLRRVIYYLAESPRRHRQLFADGVPSGDKPIQFLGDPSYFWGIAIGTGLLKDIGWGAILYLAAIAGVDQSLYEAAAIDGAGRFKRMLHITIPEIMPTVMILLIFAVSGMLNNNFTQIYVFQNTLNIDASQVIDTYLYQTGLLNFQFAMATAIGLMKSVLALVLLLGANFASKKLTQSGLF